MEELEQGSKNHIMIITNRRKNEITSIFHGRTAEFITPMYPKKGEDVFLRVQIHEHFPIQKVFLRTTYDGEEYNLPLKKLNSSQKGVLPNQLGNKLHLKWFEIKLRLETSHFQYRFRIITPESQYWFNSQGISFETPIDDLDFRINTDIKIPTWLESSIFYQIFPDRFFDGNPKNNVKDGEISKGNNSSKFRKWNDLPSHYGENYTSLHFYGGDLDGILQKIPYLKKLRINALYLNPIFTSPSNHKYDTTNYLEIDPHLGTNQEFSELTSTLHKSGFHLILDGVINHTSEDHPWFDRMNLYNSNGAYNSPTSKYRDFYYFYEGNPEKYEAWKGYKSLPRLNFQSKALREKIYQSSNSLLQFWLKPPYKIDGWRFDCANMVGKHKETSYAEEVWGGIHSTLKEINPECFLLGESFYDGSELVDGKKLDAITNYLGFFIPLSRWLTQSDGFQIYNEGKFSGFEGSYPFSTNDFMKQLKLYQKRIPAQLQHITINLLDSHDVPRFFSILNENEYLMKLSICFLFTYLGIPMIYYGDEIGLTGKQDPENRRPMEWDESNWNRSLWETYRWFIDLRLDSIALQKGNCLFIPLTRLNSKGSKHEDSKEGQTRVDPEIICYCRFLSKNYQIIILKKCRESVNVQLKLWILGFETGLVQNLTDNQQFEIIEGETLISMKENMPFFIGTIFM